MLTPIIISLLFLIPLSLVYLLGQQKSITANSISMMPSDPLYTRTLYVDYYNDSDHLNSSKPTSTISYKQNLTPYMDKDQYLIGFGDVILQDVYDSDLYPSWVKELAESTYWHLTASSLEDLSPVLELKESGMYSYSFERGPDFQEAQKHLPSYIKSFSITASGPLELQGEFGSFYLSVSFISIFEDAVVFDLKVSPSSSLPSTDWRLAPVSSIDTYEH